MWNVTSDPNPWNVTQAPEDGYQPEYGEFVVTGFSTIELPPAQQNRVVLVRGSGTEVEVTYDDGTVSGQSSVTTQENRMTKFVSDGDNWFRESVATIGGAIQEFITADNVNTISDLPDASRFTDPTVYELRTGDLAPDYVVTAQESDDWTSLIDGETLE